MVDKLHLNLLGKPQIALGSEPITGLGTAKAQALLYYLAVTGRPHSREALVDLLWGEMPEAKAKRNLTTTLTSLRKVVEPYLLIEPHNITFNNDAPHWLDVTHFQETIEASPEETGLATLQQAIELYHGEFLEGVYVKNALVFEEWVLTQRERLHELMLEGLDRLVEQFITDAEYGEGIEYATRLLEMDPWRESAHRQMMILLARSGQRSAALAQYETCRRILAEELDVEPMAETTALYERLKGTQEALPHNLPPQPNTFVGRVQEMNQLIAHLDNPDCRLLTLVGPGGMGKTRLAIEGAKRYVESDQTFGGASFSDGIYFVNLAPISLPDTTHNATNQFGRAPILLVSAIADALNLAFHGPTDLKAQLLNHLHEKEMLLVLDNFEHLVEGASLLADILQGAMGIKLLVTSRERLNLMEEWVMEIEGLNVPELSEWDIGEPENWQNTRPGPTDPLNESETQRQSINSNLESFSAVALFVQQAQQMRGDLTLTQTEMSHVVRIAQLVEGIPLALVLAAGWLRVLTCAEIVKEIEQNLDFLSASMRNIPERHRSLRVVFEQSWKMLSDEERAAFRRLSVFRGGFQRKAAQRVANASLLTLTGLVDKSLLRLGPDNRYHIHELLCQYGAEKLAMTPEDIDHIYDVHGVFYTNFLHERFEDLLGGRQREATEEIEAELDNVRAAWLWVVAQTNLEATERGLEGLVHYYLLRGPLQEGETMLKLASDPLHDLAANSDTIEVDGLALLSKLLAMQALFRNEHGKHKEAISAAQEAVDLAKTNQAIEAEAIGYLQWGDALWFQSEYEAARVQLEQALAKAQEAQLSHIEAESLRRLGATYWPLGDYEKANSLYEAALKLYRQLGNRRGETLTLNNLGNIAFDRDDLDKARHFFEQGMAINREIGNRRGEGHILNNLALVCRYQGDYAQARIYSERALHIHKETGSRWHMAHAIKLLGVIQTDLGNYEEARTHLEQALHLLREIGIRRDETMVLSFLSGVLRELGDHHEVALQIGQEAFHISQEVGARKEAADALTYVGHAHAALGNLDQASEAYEETMAIRRALNQMTMAMDALAGLARLSIAQGDLTQARSHIEPILRHLEANASPDGSRHGLEGTQQPFRIYLTCYRVLTTQKDPQATNILKTAYRLLQEQADSIEDDSLRQSFLKNVTVHREIIAAYNEMSAQKTS